MSEVQFTDNFGGDGSHNHPPKPKMSATRLTVTILAHVALLVIATVWVISEHFIDKKKELEFTSERPSQSANHKAGEHAVKMAKKKSNAGAPPNAKRLTSTSASAITIPAITTSTVNDFTPGAMGAGMGTGLSGWGTGSGVGGGGMGTGGGGGRIKFFGFDADASNVILAIDTSGSMIPNVGGETGIAKLREEIKKTVNALSPVSMFNIICFGQQADACFPKNVRASAENKEAAIKFMDGYYGGDNFGRTRTERLMATRGDVNAEVAKLDDGVPFTPLTVDKVKGLEGTAGSSRMDLALVAAMERQASAIFLLSDGQPTTSKDGRALDQNDLIDLVNDNYKRIYKGKACTINTIYTNRDRSEEDFMKKIARKFNGKHKDVQLD